MIIITIDKKESVNKQKRGMTDRMYIIDFICTWSYTLSCLILTILGPRIGIYDYSFISVGLPLVWAHFGLHTGVVVWKAKVENLSKFTGKDALKNANANINIDV